MARQEIASTFSDGLIMDLNPINTPKSVLTDCLNGTYITYNGNEFVLQNDMGNYELKNCKLPTNFIPVGVKGYGDVLYIVSYNPLTEEVEIGSYPAPQSIFTTGENLQGPGADQLSKFDIKGDDTYDNWVNSLKKPIYVWNGEDKETFKLYPGDEFCITDLDTTGGLAKNDYKYQHLNFYVIDEDNKLYDIEDANIYNTSVVDDDGYRKVFWETPGWLAAQWDLFVPDKFNLNLKNLSVQEFLTNSQTSSLSEGQSTTFPVSMDLSSQVIISDELFRNKLNESGNISNNKFTHLCVRYEIFVEEGTIKGDTSTINYKIPDKYEHYIDVQCESHNYQDDIITAYVNNVIEWDMNYPTDLENLSTYAGEIGVRAYPIIKQDDNRVVRFEQFATEYTFKLNNLKDAKDIKIADKIYKWAVDNDSCTISFNINGPFVNASDITGEYRIIKLYVEEGGKISENGQAVPVPKEEQTEETWSLIPNLVLFGQNTININFEKSETSNNKNKFIKEGGIYGLWIRLKQGDEQIGEITKLILIPSEVFNDYFSGEYDNYSNIYLNTWLGNYINHININSIIINNINEIISKTEPDIRDWLKYKWSDDTEEPQAVDLSDNQTISQWLNNQFEAKVKHSNNPDFNWNTTTQFEQTLSLYVDYSKIGVSYDINGIYNIDWLKGNLWNPEIKIDLNFKLNDGTLTNYVTSINIEENDTEIQKENITHSINETLKTEIKYNWQDKNAPIQKKPPTFPFWPALRDNYRLELRWDDRTDTDKPSVQKKGGRITARTCTNSDPNNYFIDEIIMSTDQGPTYDINGKSYIFTAIYNQLSTDSREYYSNCKLTVNGSSDRYHRSCYQGDPNNFESVWPPAIIMSKWDTITPDYVDAVMLKAFNRGVSDAGKCVFIDFKNDNGGLLRNKFNEILSNICVRYYENYTSTEWFPLLYLDNAFILNNSTTVTKLDAKIKINSLKTDKFFWIDNAQIQDIKFTNSLENYNGKRLLTKISNNVIQVSKEIYNFNISNGNFQIDFTKNEMYQKFLDGIQGWLDTNAKMYQTYLTSLENIKTGTYLSFMTENDHFNNEYPKYAIIDKNIQELFLSKLILRVDSNNDSVSVFWNNLTDTTIRAINVTNDDPDAANTRVPGSGVVDYGYYEAWTNRNIISNPD